MNKDVKDKIAKVYELIKRGVDGEKEAAKSALDRLMLKYNLDDQYLETILFKEYRFKYSTQLDLNLMVALMEYFFSDKNLQALRDTFYKKEVVIELEYLDYIVLHSAYEYFRRHMKKEYNKVVLPALKRCRKTTTRNKRRKELQTLFFSQYIIKSKLYKDGDLETIDTSNMSRKELSDRMNLKDVEGGSYNTQVTTGLYLEEKN